MQDIVARDPAQVKVRRGLDQDFGDDAGVSGWQARRPDAELVEARLQVGSENKARTRLAARAQRKLRSLRADGALLQPGLEQAVGTDDDGRPERRADFLTELVPAGLGDLESALKLHTGKASVVDTTARQVVQRECSAGIDEPADAVGRHFCELRGPGGRRMNHGQRAGPIISHAGNGSCAARRGRGGALDGAVARAIEAPQDLVKLVLDPVELSGVRGCRLGW